MKFLNLFKKKEQPKQISKFKYRLIVSIYYHNNDFLSYSTETNSTNIYDTKFYKKLWLWYEYRSSEKYVLRSNDNNGLPRSTIINRSDIKVITTKFEVN